jgi:hypothetical protein
MPRSQRADRRARPPNRSAMTQWRERIRFARLHYLNSVLRSRERELMFSGSWNSGPGWGCGAARNCFLIAYVFLWLRRGFDDQR